MKRPALVFDFGNVLAFFDYNRAATSLGRPRGLEGAVLLSRMREGGFVSHLREFEAGRLDFQTFATKVTSRVDLQVGHNEFEAAWCDIFTLNDPVVQLVAELKGEGYTLVLGSNTNDPHARHFQTQFAEALAPFDRLVLSYEVGHVKPSAEFYLACAQAAGQPPGDCVFIDDLPENVEGARVAGLQALLFRDVVQLRRELRDLGVVVSQGSKSAGIRPEGI